MTMPAAVPRGLADLSGRTQLILTGGDRVRYLNGQVSNDVRKASATEALYACVMTAKGKMCADVFISAETDRLRIDAEGALRESLVARLERYIIADHVVIEDATDSAAILHVFGVERALLPEVEALVRACNRFGIPGLDLIVDREKFSTVWRLLSSSLPVASEGECEVLRVERGVPRWGAELSEAILPVEAGLDRTAIDYNKGCYIGQEIVSRLKSVGHVNRHLRGFAAKPGGGALRAGMRLMDPAAPEREAGWITSVVYSSTFSRNLALGYLRRDTRGTTLQARNEAGGEVVCEVEVREIPFVQ
jgi:tRNA-modifying protein YgfZ